MNSEFNDEMSKSPIEGWTYKRLIDCTSDGNLSYGIVQPGTHDENGIPIVRVNNVNNGQLRLNDVLHVSAEIESKYKRTRLEGGEVLLTLVGSTGQSVVAPKELAGWNIARAIAVIRPKPEIGANWINICLQTREVQQFLNERANTTVQKTLNLGDVRELPIPIPPDDVKKQIEDIAMSLADKIELNRQINQTLEQIAQTIFKSWFVDFEPVKAKIEAKAAGRDPERAAMCAISGKLEPELDQLPPEHYQQLAATAALFPHELVESELGMIPGGWEVKSLAEMVQLIGGGTPKRSSAEFWGGDILWFSVQDAPADGDVFVIDTEEKITRNGLEKSSTRLLPVGTTIISARGTVGRLALVGAEMAMNQSCYGVKGADGVGLYFNYFNLKEAVSALQQNTHGAVFDTITRQTFETVTCFRPTKSVLDGFEGILAPLMRKICSNVHERKNLATLRDALLPKLLSGELTVENLPLETTA